MERDGETRDGDVTVRDGRLEQVGGSCEPAAAAEVLDASDAFVLPGFIQGHVHVAQSLLRHQADELRLLDWLQLRTWPYEAALRAEDVAAAASLGLAELICGGTTCAVDFGTVHHQDEVFATAERFGARMISGKIHMDAGDGVPARLIEQPTASLAEAESLGRRWHGAAGGRLRYAAAPRFVLSCSRGLLEGCRDLARSHGWLLQTHAAENAAEVAVVRRDTGRGNVAALGELDLVGPDVILAHCVWLDEDEVDLLAATRTTVCHCPGANLKLGSGIAPVPQLARRGIPLLLGADGPPCNNRLSAFREMWLAATLHGLDQHPGVVSAWQALAMVTREAATALGWENDIGTLTPGKAADLVVVDAARWSLLPGGDVAARLVYGGDDSMVRHVVVDGRVLVRDGRLNADDPDRLVAEARTAWRRVADRMESTP